MEERKFLVSKGSEVGNGVVVDSGDLIEEVGSVRGKLVDLKDQSQPSKRSIERVVFVPDMHIPYYDRQAFRTVLNFISDIKPEIVVILGDLLDFGPVSKFDQDPREAVNIQEQLDEANLVLDQLRSRAGRKALIYYLEGNHETRLTKHLIKKDKELIFLKKDGIDVLSIPYLLDLKKRKVEWYPAKKSLILYNWNIEHGDISSQYSCYTAKRMVDRRRKSTIIGHVHRVGLYAYTGYDTTTIGVEAGSLIDRDSPASGYVKNPNWQTGFTIGEYSKAKDLFQVTPILMQNYMFIFGGKLYDNTVGVAKP